SEVLDHAEEIAKSCQHSRSRRCELAADWIRTRGLGEGIPESPSALVFQIDTDGDVKGGVRSAECAGRSQPVHDARRVRPGRQLHDPRSGGQERPDPGGTGTEVEKHVAECGVLAALKRLLIEYVASV